MLPISSLLLRTQDALRRYRERREARGYPLSRNPPPSGLDRETVQTLVDQVPFWWHHLELGHGIVTPGHHNGEGNPLGSRQALRRLHLPDDLSGRSVLDVGTWDGFFSFEAERRGAKRVLAVDKLYRVPDEQHALNAPVEGTLGFRTAKRILCSKVDFAQMDVLDFTPERPGRFDVVLFLGVLYHVRHPLLALERVAAVTGDLLILETQYTAVGGSRPLMVYYPDDALNRDATNWWVPNLPCLEAMMRSVGFSQLERVSQTASRVVMHATR